MGRHDSGVVRAPGPITAAQRIIAAHPRRKPSWIVLRIWPAIPALVLIWPAMHGRLLAYADSVIGYDATLSLIACLAVTPVITVSKMPIGKLRWWYGMWVFVLGAAGLAIHLSYPPGSIAHRAAGDAINWTGTLIVALLLPMAVTSTAFAQRVLGPEWKRWQRNLIWIVWLAVGVHLVLAHVWLVAASYGGATLPAIAIRQSRLRHGIQKWRTGGYSTGGWWAVLFMLATICVAGLLVLFGEEVYALARAATLA